MRGFTGLAGLVIALALSSCVTAQDDRIRLGFLVPYPTGDSAVPIRLANEWISAVRVALEVLGKKYESKFKVEAIVQNSNCDYASAVESAKILVGESVVGVVGPACSEAVKGANTVLGPAGIPFISFAATLDDFSGSGFENFFRTVHADSYQAAAFAKVISHFKWQKVILFHTDEAYGNNLRDKIHLSASTVSEWIFRKVAYPPPTDPDQYLEYFKDDQGNSLTSQYDNSTIAILAVTPNAAEGLWKAALKHNDREYLRYPWWFFGSDGTTAVDLVEQAGDDLEHLARTVQGQIGLAPYKGNYAGNSPMQEFRDYWANQPYDEYPGLLTLPVNDRFKETRPYVTNLIDAIWAFYYMFDHLMETHSGQPITPAMLLECLRDTQTNCAVFKGTSGTVGFSPDTGDRRLEFDDARYSFVNLIKLAWAEKSSVRATDTSEFEVDVTKMQRPGPFPPGVDGITIPEAQQLSDGDIPQGVDTPYAEGFGSFTPPTTASATNSGLSGGAIAGIVIMVIVAVGLIAGGTWYFIKRRSQADEAHTQFVRML